MKVAVIGAGKMACALTQGLIRSRLAEAGDIVGVARSEESKARFLALNPALRWSPDISAAVGGADLVLLGVKPAQVPEILGRISPFHPATLYISVAAGVTLASMHSVLGGRARLVRAMPNTPVVVGEGVTAFAAGEGATSGDVETVRKIFSALGRVYEVKENELDAVTALSGSGPAYFYLFMDFLQKAAVREGLPSALACEMAAQTALGAAEMILQDKGTPEALIAQVKSKGGTTEAALNVLIGKNLEKIVSEAVGAAANRSRELSAKP